MKGVTKILLNDLRKQNEDQLQRTTDEKSKSYLQGKIDAYTVLIGDRLSEHPKNRAEIWKD